jgi:hypothetical protein
MIHSWSKSDISSLIVLGSFEDLKQHDIKCLKNMRCVWWVCDHENPIPRHFVQYWTRTTNRTIIAEQKYRFIFASREIAIRDDSWDQNFVDVLIDNILGEARGTCNLDFEIDPITHPMSQISVRERSPTRVERDRHHPLREHNKLTFDDELHDQLDNLKSHPKLDSELTPPSPSVRPSHESRTHQC